MVRVGLLRAKGVHIKLDKETHASFRTRLIAIDISMQQAFAEFARLVGEGDARASKIVENLAMRQVKKELESAPSAALRPHKPKELDVLDHDTLYNLINDDDSDSTGPQRGGDHGKAA